MASDPDNELDAPEDTPTGHIVGEAKKRFKRCVDWESQVRKLAMDDLKFSLADPDNKWQWDDEISRNRDFAKKPCLTINKVRIHCLQIENDAKQNKPSVNVRAVGNGATYDAAQVFEGIVRHIEYISQAADAYMTASKFQIRTGIGYWRVATDYADNDSFDQEIFIRRIKDPATVYLDPDINEIDGSDAKFGFIYDDMAPEDFKATYPGHEDVMTHSALGEGDDWISADHVRVCEYFRKVKKKDRLLRITHPADGRAMEIRESKLPKEFKSQVVDDPHTKSRDIYEDEIEWFLIAAQKIIDRTDWPGRYVPIVRVVGEETIVERKLDRKGHVRPMKDAQKMYNYWTSEATTQVALQTKSPWIVDVASIEGFETYWRNMNTANYAYVPYKSRDDQNRELAKPERAQPPAMSQAYMQGMQTAQQEMMMATGQYQAQMGENENAKSGKAISERQRQGDNATYHFIEGLSIAIRFTGRILIDLIPKIYDTPRVIKILAENGEESEVQVDPSSTAAYLEQQAKHGEEVRAIFNPNVGKYEVEADIGPAYATKRQEAFNAFTQIIAANAEMVNIVGDLMMKAADFPMADELAERLRRMVPPQALGEAPPPALAQAMAQAQEQNKQLQTLVAELMQQISEDKIKLKGREEQKDIDVFKAETERMKALGSIAPVDPNEISGVVKQTIQEMLGTTLEPIIKANSGKLREDAANDMPIPGARKAPDGQHYLPDPSRPGKYIHVAPYAPPHGARKAPDGKHYIPDPTRPGKYIHVGKRAA